MTTFQQNRPRLSPCATHHLSQNDQPLYSRRFDEALPFHEPGLAPVKLNGKAWHIQLDGTDGYEQRFDRSFGFYCSLAAVCQEGRWFHILPNGHPLYMQRYAFAGNFQEGFCVVCNTQGDYFHIDQQGHAIYTARWQYCGDFKGGIAVVQSPNGLSTHINTSGKEIHRQWFDDLDIYHKNFARAQDQQGWCHIDLCGTPLYAARFAKVEPFYNGCSRVETHHGRRIIIDENGKILRELRPASPFREHR